MAATDNRRSAIRTLLNEMFRTESDLHSLFVDHFYPDLSKHVSDRMSHQELITALMKHVDPEPILNTLQTAYPQEFAAAQRKIHMTQPGPTPAPPREDAARSDSSRSPVPLPDDYVRVPRTALAERILRDELLYQRRATLLQVHRGGGRSLALEIAELAARDGMTSIWLEDFASEQTGVAEFYKKLTDDPEVRDADGFYTWLNRRSTPRPLIILYGSRGPADLIEEVASTLSSFLTARSSDSAFLSIGGERLLRLCVPARYFTNTLFAPATFVDVPDLSLDEVQQVLTLHTLPGELAPLYYEHSGGHPGLLHRLVHKKCTDPADALRCIRPELSGVLNRHLEDPQARAVLRKLLNREPVAPLSDPCIRHSPSHYAEARMYFDGLLRVDSEGRTGVRCPAVGVLLEGAAATQSLITN